MRYRVKHRIRSLLIFLKSSLTLLCKTKYMGHPRAAIISLAFDLRYTILCIAKYLLPEGSPPGSSGSSVSTRSENTHPTE
jgi:hypothetical protein